MNSESIEALSTYPDTRVILSKRTGELGLAIPLYVDNKGAFINEKDMLGIIGVEVSMGIYEKLGYLVCHPEFAPTFMNASIMGDIVEDLGLLNNSFYDDLDQSDQNA